MPQQAERAFDCVIIGGFGHVGLPLGIVLADHGYVTGLVDIDTSKRPLIEKGVMPFIEYGADPLLKRVIGKTLFVCSLEDVRRAKIVVITIGTPVDEYLGPKMRGLFALADTLVPFLRKQCVILRSTVYPGTSASLAAYLREKGCFVDLAFCPERIVQGYAIQELTELPQIIAGATPKAVRTAKEMFKRLGVETLEVGLEEAELSKLFLNAWRYIQFAIGNQFYMIASDRGLEYARVHKAMTHHYKRGDVPGPGFAAGPCLLKDTMQLAAACRDHFVLGHGAMMVNEGLPGYIVEQLKAKRGGSLRGSTVGILGMAFKANIDDTRDSLSFKLRKILQFHGAHVLCSDEYAKHASFIPARKLASACDSIIVGVPHSAYRNLRIPAKTTILDVWGILP